MVQRAWSLAVAPAPGAPAAAGRSPPARRPRTCQVELGCAGRLRVVCREPAVIMTWREEQQGLHAWLNRALPVVCPLAAQPDAAVCCTSTSVAHPSHHRPAEVLCLRAIAHAKNIQIATVPQSRQAGSGSAVRWDVPLLVPLWGHTCPASLLAACPATPGLVPLHGPGHIDPPTCGHIGPPTCGGIMGGAAAAGPSRRAQGKQPGSQRQHSCAGTRPPRLPDPHSTHRLAHVLRAAGAGRGLHALRLLACRGARRDEARALAEGWSPSGEQRQERPKRAEDAPSTPRHAEKAAQQALPWPGAALIPASSMQRLARPRTRGNVARCGLVLAGAVGAVSGRVLRFVACWGRGRGRPEGGEGQANAIAADRRQGRRQRWQGRGSSGRRRRHAERSLGGIAGACGTQQQR